MASSNREQLEKASSERVKLGQQEQEIQQELFKHLGEINQILAKDSDIQSKNRFDKTKKVEIAKIKKKYEDLKDLELRLLLNSFFIFENKVFLPNDPLHGNQNNIDAKVEDFIEISHEVMAEFFNSWEKLVNVKQLYSKARAEEVRLEKKVMDEEMKAEESAKQDKLKKAKTTENQTREAERIPDATVTPIVVDSLLPQQPVTPSIQAPVEPVVPRTRKNAEGSSNLEVLVSAQRWPTGPSVGTQLKQVQAELLSSQVSQPPQTVSVDIQEEQELASSRTVLDEAIAMTNTLLEPSNSQLSAASQNEVSSPESMSSSDTSSEASNKSSRPAAPSELIEPDPEVNPSAKEADDNKPSIRNAEKSIASIREAVENAEHIRKNALEVQLEKVIKGIANYQKLQGSHLCCLVRFFDGKRGERRAELYAHALEPKNDNYNRQEKLYTLYALLTSKDGLRLQEEVLKSVYGDESKIRLTKKEFELFKSRLKQDIYSLISSEYFNTGIDKKETFKHEINAIQLQANNKSSSQIAFDFNYKNLKRV